MAQRPPREPQRTTKESQGPERAPKKTKRNLMHTKRTPKASELAETYPFLMWPLTTSKATFNAGQAAQVAQQLGWHFQAAPLPPLTGGTGGTAVGVAFSISTSPPLAGGTAGTDNMELSFCVLREWARHRSHSKLVIPFIEWDPQRAVQCSSLEGLWK